MRKFGGKFHRKLNISSSPIANKYHEGKVKSTLKRELNVPEIVVNQAIGINVVEELWNIFEPWIPCGHLTLVDEPSTPLFEIPSG